MIGNDFSGRKPIEALFSKIFGQLAELDALVDAQIGYWARRHKFSQEDLLNHRIFDRIEAWCGSMEALMLEWEKSDNRDLELVNLYFDRKISLEKELARVRVKIIHRKETFGDAVARVVNNTFDRIMNWIARKLGISQISYRRRGQIEYQKRDGDGDN